MPLLIDGNPYQLKDSEIKTWGRKLKWHVPPRPRTNNNPHINDGIDLPAGVSIPNSYLMVVNGRRSRVTYYTRDQWDEGLKKMFYLVDSTGESIEIGSKGYIETQNPELNYFLANNPHNANNSLRTGDSSDPYINTTVLFHMYEPRSQYKFEVAKAEAIKKLTTYISHGNQRSWNSTDIKLACEHLIIKATWRLPDAIVHFKEYLEEENLETLRNALIASCLQNPLVAEEILLKDNDNIYLNMINKSLEFGEISGLVYTEADHRFNIRKKDGTFELLVQVDKRRNPNQFLLDTMKNNEKVRSIIWKMHDKVVSELIRQVREREEA